MIMSSSEYTEDILSIAVFMGIETIKAINSYTGATYYYYNNVHAEDYEGLPFYNDWNELMPVVEKIQSLGFKFIIGDQNRVTVYNKDYDWRNGHTSDSLITCVWHGVVSFIKWYNQQSK